MYMQELREHIYKRAGRRCEWCGKFGAIHSFELAHRIKQDKTPGGNGSVKYVQEFAKYNYNVDIIKTKAREILHDEDNLRLACPGYCNSRFNIFYKPKERDALMIHLLKKYEIIQEEEMKYFVMLNTINNVPMPMVDIYNSIILFDTNDEADRQGNMSGVGHTFGYKVVEWEYCGGDHVQ